MLSEPPHTPLHNNDTPFHHVMYRCVPLHNNDTPLHHATPSSNAMAPTLSLLDNDRVRAMIIVIRPSIHDTAKSLIRHSHVPYSTPPRPLIDPARSLNRHSHVPYSTPSYTLFDKITSLIRHNHVPISDTCLPYRLRRRPEYPSDGRQLPETDR